MRRRSSSMRPSAVLIGTHSSHSGSAHGWREYSQYCTAPASRPSAMSQMSALSSVSAILLPRSTALPKASLNGLSVSCMAWSWAHCLGPTVVRRWRWPALYRKRPGSLKNETGAGLLTARICLLRSGATMADERNQEPQMDAAALYREELFTDRKVGAIRQLTPVTSDGAPDTTRPVLFLGQAEIMTNMGPVPLSFEIEGKTLADAVVGFAAAATVAIERTVQQIQEMRRQAASQLVVPQGGMPNLGPGAPGGRGGKIQIP